ncbi:MAG: bifunctional diaminohydroxyphosphoribosylaminopyrimidine deaminase/5-amino-6-(5-phosphoribosylamino)uracil reductase RibD [Chthoniobacterales bacterium]
MHDRFMDEALAEGRKGIGLTSPNPAVGAVLVRGGKILARGHHRAAGRPHAEIECLRNFGEPVPEDATLYVTMEPCSTSGRTPPCIDALIEAKVRRVVIGTVDPNPLHAGRGIKLLRAAGVEVIDGIRAAECGALNEAFNKWIRTKRPFVVAKCGMTLDGRLTRPAGEDRSITSTASRRHANRFRAQVDAILVGAETVRADNPELTVRGVRGARQPWRVVLTRSQQLPKTAHLFSDRFAQRTLVFRDQPLELVLDSLGEKEVTSVLIEGGGDILSQALDARLIDKFHIYVGAMFSGGSVVAFAGCGASSTNSSVRLRDVRYEPIASDVLVIGNAEYPQSSSEY